MTAAERVLTHHLECGFVCVSFSLNHLNFSSFFSLLFLNKSLLSHPQKSINRDSATLKLKTEMGNSADSSVLDQCRCPLVEIWDHPLAATDADF